MKSEAKRVKESAMNSRFKDRFEEGLAAIESSLHKKGGVKQTDNVHERIGRLKEKYPSIHRFYQIDVENGEKNVVTSLAWHIKCDTVPDQDNGVYLLRTSITQTDETLVWTAYNTIREIEATFRVWSGQLFI